MAQIRILLFQKNINKGWQLYQVFKINLNGFGVLNMFFYAFSRTLYLKER